MPDRPSGRPPRGDDEPEFDWLYGGGSGTGSADDDPDRTQLMPAAQRPQPRSAPRPAARPQSSGSGSGGSGRNRPPSAPVSPRPAPKQRKRGRTARRVILGIVALWVVFLIAVPFWAWGKITKVDADPSADRPADQPGTTYLLVGSDSRAGLSAEQRKKLGTGDAAGQRTDTIMLLHVGSGPNLLLSIPRDSLVPIPGHGTTKINAAFAYGGPKLLVRTIEQNTGVRIDDYVEIGMGGVVNSVDAVGGVRVCTKKRLVDKLANLRMKKGCHQVDGVTALAFSRTRHTQQLGDIGRAENQRAVLSQVGSKVKSPWTVLNPWRYLAIAKAGSSSITINEGMSPLALGRFALAMTKVNGTDGLTCSMPIRDLAVHWDSQRALAMMKLIKEDRTEDIGALCTASGIAGQ